MQRPLVTFEERVHPVEDQDEFPTEHTHWVVHPAEQLRGQLVRSPQSYPTPPSFPPRATRTNPGLKTGSGSFRRPGEARSSGGSNVASLIPRPMLAADRDRLTSPDTDVGPVGQAAITPATVRIVAASAGVSALALIGTGILCGAVILAALLHDPNASAPRQAQANPGSQANPGAGQPASQAPASPVQAPALAAGGPAGAVPVAQASPAPGAQAARAPTAPTSGMPPGGVTVPGLTRGRSAPSSPPLAVLEAARPQASPPPAPSPAPSDNGWLDGLVNLVSGSSSPARSPSLADTLSPAASPPAAAPVAAAAQAPGTQPAGMAAPGLSSALPGAAAPSGGPIALDDGLDNLDASRSQPVLGSTADKAANDATLALLASLDEPTPARAPTPGQAASGRSAPAQAAPTPVSDDSWLDSLVSVGTSLANSVLGSSEPEVLPPIASTGASALSPPPGTASPTGAAPSRVSLAETLGAPVVAEAGPIALDDGLGALTEELGAERRTAVDPTVASMLAELDKPSSAPGTASSAPTPASAARAPVSPPPSAAQKVSEEGGWLDSVVAMGDGLRSLVTGSPQGSAEPDSFTSGTLPPLSAGGTSAGVAPGRPSLAATLAPSGPVDLLEGEDGLSDLGGASRAAQDRTGGFGTAAASDDPALALLAELDGPAPTRSAAPAAAPVLGGTASEGDSWLDDVIHLGTDVANRVVGAPAPKVAPGTPAQGSSSAAAPVGDSMNSLMSELAAERSGSAAPAVLPVQAPAASGASSEAGWLESMVALGTSIVTGVGLGTAEPEGLSPTLPPIELDDGLGLQTSRTGQGTAGADPKVASILAELDAPAPAKTAAAARTLGPPPEAIKEDSWLDTLSAVGSGIASLVTGSSSSPPSLAATLGDSPGTAGPSRASGPSLASVLGTPEEASAPARLATPTAARAPTPPPSSLAPLSTPTARSAPPPKPTATFETVEFAGTTYTAELPSKAPEKEVCVGEFCGDISVLEWRDPVSGEEVDLLADDYLDFEYEPSGTSVAELFYSASDDDELNPVLATLEELGTGESLSVIPLVIRTSEPGVAVEIDGKTYGRTPVLGEIAPGTHTVKLVGSFGGVTTYQLNATGSAAEWCFDARGRTFRYVRCL